MLRVHCVLTECFDFFVVNNFFNVFVVDNFDFLEFVRSTESIEEVTERYAGFDSCEVSYESHVHCFLYGVGTQECKTGLTTSHYVLMVTKDGQCVRSKSTSGNMENAREKLTSNFVHVWNHEQEALRRCESRGQRACCETAVYRASCTSFGLELTDRNCLVKNVLFAGSSPVVCSFCHVG